MAHRAGILDSQLAGHDGSGPRRFMFQYQDDAVPVSYFYCPLKDSRESLFCELTPSTVKAVPTVLRGILEPADLRLYGDFEKVLNAKLPARIGILRPGTAQSANARAASGVRDVFATGGVLAALGFIGIVWKRRRKA